MRHTIEKEMEQDEMMVSPEQFQVGRSPQNEFEYLDPEDDDEDDDDYNFDDDFDEEAEGLDDDEDADFENPDDDPA